MLHLLLVDVRDVAHWRRDHLDGRNAAVQLLLVVDELAEEARIWSDDHPAAPAVSKRIPQRHAVVFHEVRDADRRRPADAGHAVDKRAAAAVVVGADLVGDAVEVERDACVRHVVDVDLDRLDAGQV